MRELIALSLTVITSSVHAQAACLRPSSVPMAQCIGASNSVRELAACGEVVETYNKDVEAWLKCQLDALDQDHRERRAGLLERAAAMKNSAAEALTMRSRLR